MLSITKEFNTCNDSFEVGSHSCCDLPFAWEWLGKVDILYSVNGSQLFATEALYQSDPLFI